MFLLRPLQIGGAGLWLLVQVLAARLGLGAPAPAAFPRRLRLTLESLGPTFVKLGQALSQRRDLLPASWIAELSRLQESARPFDSALAVSQIEAGLGASLTDLFSEFQLEPIAAASVAQIHRARLKDAREVIVKVLRPNVRRQIDRDMRILLTVVRLAAFITPPLARLRPTMMVREIWLNLRKETDLREEANNIRRFVAAFSGSESIYIPDAPAGLDAEAVLVQEFSTGRRLDDDEVVKTDGPRLASVLVNAYLKQLFKIGFFHADPHPGNLFVMDDGRLCFHDFGAVGFLDMGSRRALAGFMQAVAHEDPTWAAQAAVALGLLPSGADPNLVRRGIEAILADFAATPLNQLSLASLFVAVARLGGTGSMFLPAHLAALVRTVFAAEGTLRLLDPALNLLDALKTSDQSAITSSLIAGDGGLARLKWEAALSAQSLPVSVANLLGRARSSDGFAVSIRLAEADPLFGRLARAADRVALALVTLGLYVAASLLMQHSIGPRIFGDLPLLAAGGYLMALWLTVKLLRGIGRTGGV